LTPPNYSNGLPQAAPPFSTKSKTISKPSDGEQSALCNALETLSALRTIAEREIGEQKKTGI
jgi:hypothetical protein